MRVVKKRIQYLLNRWRGSRTVQKALTPFGKALTPRRWIFVVGCYNSGTTLLERILSSHPDTGGLPAEGVFLTDALCRPEDFGWTRMWSQCLDQIRISGSLPELEKRAARIKRQWSLWYPSKAVNLVEKSVANTPRLLFLQSCFQPAYFVYIIRNGYAVAEGIRRRAVPSRWNNPVYRERYPIDLCAQQWRASEELMNHDAAGIERLIQVYYEDLTADPERTLKRITDFLGLAPLPPHIVKRSWWFQGKSSPIRDMNPESFQRLSREDIAIIQQAAGFRLSAHGYHPPPEIHQ